MGTKYLVLRAKHAGHLEGLYHAGRKALPSGADPDSLAIETVDGHETDIGHLREDPRNIAVTDAESVFSLVTPLSSGPADMVELKLADTQWMTPGLLAVGAHTTPFAGRGVTVAVLDTGIDVNHPAFAGKTLVTRDFTGEGKNESDVSDKDGHGTHCAGTICGAPVDDVRVGVAPGVTKLCVAKVLGKQGGTAEMLFRGLHWAVMEQRAAVVSLSLGYDLPGNVKRLLARGVDVALATNVVLRQHADLVRTLGALRVYLEAVAPNVIFLVATGNESKRPDFVIDAALPASELLGVGAVELSSPSTEKWSVAKFSNGRAQMVAPGVNVVSAKAGGGWLALSGTSMATPHVAGVAAVWREKLRAEGGDAVPGALRAALKASATKQPLLNKDADAVGVGMVRCPY